MTKITLHASWTATGDVKAALQQLICLANQVEGLTLAQFNVTVDDNSEAQERSVSTTKGPHKRGLHEDGIPRQILEFMQQDPDLEYTKNDLRQHIKFPRPQAVHVAVRALKARKLITFTTRDSFKLARA